ncbi:hypothetical protein JCM11641_002232 [Rhodosporidiobolus odoratus]
MGSNSSRQKSRQVGTLPASPELLVTVSQRAPVHSALTTPPMARKGKKAAAAALREQNKRIRLDPCLDVDPANPAYRPEEHSEDEPEQHKRVAIDPEFAARLRLIGAQKRDSFLAGNKQEKPVAAKQQKIATVLDETDTTMLARVREIGQRTNERSWMEVEDELLPVGNKTASSILSSLAVRSAFSL